MSGTVVLPGDPTVVVTPEQTVSVVEVDPQIVVTPEAHTDVVLVPADTIVVNAGVGPQGPPGPPGADGSGSAVTVVAGQVLQAWRAVLIRPDGLAYLADNDVPSDGEQTTGVTTSAALAGELVVIALDGRVLDTSPTTWTVGPLWLGDDGALVTGLPPVAAFGLQVAVALTTTRLLVRPQRPIYQ